MTAHLDYHHPLTVTMADSMAVASFKQDLSRVVDPDKPLGPQIWDCNHSAYLKLVNSPHWLFVESPRLYESDVVEFFSHRKWYTVPYAPCLMIGYNFYAVSSW